MQASEGTQPGRRSRLISAAALLVVCLAFGSWLAVTIAGDHPADFYVYYIAGELGRQGHSFYAISEGAWNQSARQLGVTHFMWPYRYPPYTAALVGAFAPLGPFRAMVVWEVADALALVAGAVLLGLALGGGWRIALALAALACFGPAYHTLLDGQVNGFVFLALTVAWWGLARGRDVSLGVGVAVATALKLTPAALLVYLAWRRRWRALLVAVATLAVLTVVSLPITGAGAYSQYVRRAYALTDPGNVNPSAANQTATGALGRLLLPAAVKVDSGAAASAVRAIAQVFAMALVAATVFVLWPPQRRRTDPLGEGAASAGELLGFGLIVAACLVIGPFTWYHQFVLLLIPLVTLACRAVEDCRWRLVAALALLVVGIDANEIVWVALHDGVIASGWYRSLSLPFAAALAVWALSAAPLVTARRRQRARREVGVAPVLPTLGSAVRGQGSAR